MRTPSKIRQSFGNLTLQVCSVGARVLMLLTAILLLVMPWTEHFCNFDKFLRGGQDVEFGLLALLMVFSLVLVLAQHGKSHVLLRLDLRRWLARLFHRQRSFHPASITHGIALLLSVPRLYSPPGTDNLPFQV